MHTCYKFEHFRPDEAGVDELIWVNGLGELSPGIKRGSPEALEALMDAPWQENFLTDQGEADILDNYFRATAGAVFATLYFRLYNDTPVESDTLATLTGEVSGTGYPGTNSVTRDTTGWPTLGVGASDTQQVTSRQVTWTAGSAWTAATYLALASAQTGTTGRLTAVAALSATRTLANGDTLNATLAIRLG